MAELVDALVSNTNAARRTGSSPVLGTTKVTNQLIRHLFYYWFVTTSDMVRHNENERCIHLKNRQIQKSK